MGNVSAGTIINGQSSLHGNMNRDKLWSDGWWCEFCICSGTVIGNIGEPFIADEDKSLCDHSTCQCTNPTDPAICSEHQVLCCITEQCKLPKEEGSPTCVCFNKILAGDKGATSGWKPKLFTWTNAFDNQFWVYYFLCMGCGVHAPSANDRPLVAYHDKFLCIEEACQCVKLTEEGVLCTSLSTTLCYWDQCEFPPQLDKNPVIALCGFKLKSPTAPTGGKPMPMTYGKPGQQEMS